MSASSLLTWTCPRRRSAIEVRAVSGRVPTVSAKPLKFAAAQLDGSRVAPAATIVDTEHLEADGGEYDPRRDAFWGTRPSPCSWQLTSPKSHVMKSFLGEEQGSLIAPITAKPGAMSELTEISAESIWLAIGHRLRRKVLTRYNRRYQPVCS